MAETDEIRRKRILFQSAHRGSKEMDLVLGAFARRHLAAFSAAELDDYERILAAEDSDIWNWLTARADPPAALRSVVLRQLQAFDFASEQTG